MVTFQEGTLTITTTSAGGRIIVSLSENNSGAVHEASFAKPDLVEALKRAKAKKDDSPLEHDEPLTTDRICHTHVWRNHPRVGFTTIWAREMGLDPVPIYLTDSQLSSLFEKLQ